ncbi:MAG: SEC-C domain-containing protein [Spirochaetales bacterium]|nr:SEC-C domain-containing protein [Spirochaetales bacterium]
MEKRFDGKKMVEIYSGKKEGKLGSKNNPVKLLVKTKAREKEVRSVCEKNGWECEITVDASSEENTGDLEFLLHPVKTVTTDKTPGRNDPCPCGSGKKYKHCCNNK